MAIRLVSAGGNVVDSTFVNVYASGVIQRNSIVEFNRSTSGLGTAFNVVSPAGSNSTVTTVFGVSLDYVQGTSDTFVKVIPFLPGQMWEVDCVNAISTLQVGKKHQIYNNLLINNTSYDQTGVTGVFFCWNVDGATTGSGKLLGEFIRIPTFAQNGTVAF